jgi:hypothetical protein
MTMRWAVAAEEPDTIMIVSRSLLSLSRQTKESVEKDIKNPPRSPFEKREAEFLPL